MSEEDKTWHRRGEFIDAYLKGKGKTVSIHEKSPEQLGYRPARYEGRIKASLENMKKKSRGTSRTMTGHPVSSDPGFRGDWKRVQ